MRVGIRPDLLRKRECERLRVSPRWGSSAFQTNPPFWLRMRSPSGWARLFRAYGAECEAEECIVDPLVYFSVLRSVLNFELFTDTFAFGEARRSTPTPGASPGVSFFYCAGTARYGSPQGFRVAGLHRVALPWENSVLAGARLLLDPKTMPVPHLRRLLILGLLPTPTASRTLASGWARLFRALTALGL